MQKLIKILLVSCLAVLSVYSFGLSAETVSQKKKTATVKDTPASTQAPVTADTSAPSDARSESMPATVAVGNATPDDAKINAIKAKMKVAFPQITLDAVDVSPLKGWFEATAGNAILYISEDGRHLLAGELLDLDLPESERDLTENVRRGMRLKLLNNLNTKDMIIYPVKEGQKKRATVLAFIDSDCGYCHKLHEEIGKLTDSGIELQYMAFPRAGVGSSTYNHMVSAWCAENRNQVFDALMKGEEIPAKECTNPVADQFLLGQKLGISGTPTLFFEDGTMIPGYMTADKLAEEAVKHPKPAANEKKQK